MHFILEPLARVGLTIRPHILTLPGDLILVEGACVDAAVAEGEHTLAILLTVLVATFIAGAIRPGLNTLAVLLVFKPLTNISGTVSMLVGTLAVSLVI